MDRISSGPGGTHTRLPHRSPCVHDTSLIYGNTPWTNQELVHRSKGPLSHGNGLKTPHTPPYLPWDPQGSHLDERRHQRSYPGISGPHRSTDPTLQPLVPPFHVSACHDESKAVTGACQNIPPGSCNSFSWKIYQLGPYSTLPRIITSLAVPKAAAHSQGESPSLPWPINRWRGGKNRDTISPNDESFPSKERPLLGR
jgi:hypothetical protein